MLYTHTYQRSLCVPDPVLPEGSPVTADSTGDTLCGSSSRQPYQLCSNYPSEPFNSEIKQPTNSAEHLMLPTPALWATGALDRTSRIQGMETGTCRPDHPDQCARNKLDKAMSCNLPSLSLLKAHIFITSVNIRMSNKHVMTEKSQKFSFYSYLKNYKSITGNSAIHWTHQTIKTRHLQTK